MHPQYEIPVAVAHLLKASITQHARIVDEDVDTAEISNRGVNYLIPIFHAVVIGDCFSTKMVDLFDDTIRGLELD